jgi:hypothetical protein
MHIAPACTRSRRVWPLCILCRQSFFTFLQEAIFTVEPMTSWSQKRFNTEDKSCCANTQCLPHGIYTQDPLLLKIHAHVSLAWHNVVPIDCYKKFLWTHLGKGNACAIIWAWVNAGFQISFEPGKYYNVLLTAFKEWIDTVSTSFFLYRNQVISLPWKLSWDNLVWSCTAVLPWNQTKW